MKNLGKKLVILAALFIGQALYGDQSSKDLACGLFGNDSKQCKYETLQLKFENFEFPGGPYKDHCVFCTWGKDGTEPNSFFIECDCEYSDRRYFVTSTRDLLKCWDSLRYGEEKLEGGKIRPILSCP